MKENFVGYSYISVVKNNLIYRVWKPKVLLSTIMILSIFSKTIKCYHCVIASLKCTMGLMTCFSLYKQKLWNVTSNIQYQKGLFSILLIPSSFLFSYSDVTQLLCFMDAVCRNSNVQN